MADEWNDLAEWWDARMGEHGDWFNNMLLKPCYREVLEGLFPERKGVRVLDIGCGNGHLARFLDSLGFDVTGIDTSAAMIEHAKAYAGYRVRYAVGTVTSYALAEAGALGTYDVFIINNALQDMPADQVEDTFAGICALAAPGAHVLIGMRHPCFHPKSTDVGWLIESPGGERFFTGQGLTRTLDKGIEGTGVYFAMDDYFASPVNDRSWEGARSAGQTHTVAHGDAVSAAGGPTSDAATVSYNRTLSVYFKLFTSLGCRVVDIEEPRPQMQDDTLVCDLVSRIPQFIVYHLQVEDARV